MVSTSWKYIPFKVLVSDVNLHLYIEAVFDGGRRAGWLQGKEEEKGEGGGVKADHLGFGMVMGEDGKRFRTRSGETVRLVELLDEARDRCFAQLEERGKVEELGKVGMCNRL